MTRQSNPKIDLSEKIRDELAYVHFSSQEKVLRRTHPMKLTDRLSNIWNKELEIPVLPLLTVGACILLIGLGIYDVSLENLFLQDGTKQQRELVDTGVGIYWSDLLEKAVSRNEA